MFRRLWWAVRRSEVGGLGVDGQGQVAGPLDDRLRRSARAWSRRQPGDGRLVRDDPRHPGAALDFTVEALEAFGGGDPGAMLDRERHVGKDIGLDGVHPGGDVGRSCRATHGRCGSTIAPSTSCGSSITQSNAHKEAIRRASHRSPRAVSVTSRRTPSWTAAERVVTERRVAVTIRASVRALRWVLRSPACGWAPMGRPTHPGSGSAFGPRAIATSEASGMRPASCSVVARVGRAGRASLAGTRFRQGEKRLTTLSPWPGGCTRS